MSKRLLRALKSDVVVLATLSATMLFFFDALLEAVLESRHRSLSPIAGMTLWGGCLAVQLGVSAMLGIVDTGAKWIERISRKRVSAKKAVAYSFATAAAVLFFFKGRALGSGDWISRRPYAAGMGPVAALVGGAAFFFVGLMRSEIRARAAASKAAASKAAAVAFYTAACGVCAAAAGILDALVYPGLYPAFHHLAFFNLAVFLGLFTETFVKRGSNALPIRISALSRGIALLIAGFGIFLFFAPSQEIRAELLSKRRLAATLLPLSFGVRREARLLTVLERISRKLPISFPQPLYLDSTLVVPKDWNVILVVVDAMRADTLPPNRRPNQEHAGLEDTPFLDQWVKNTFQFQFAYSPSNMTDRAMPSIFSGLYPSSLRNKSKAPLSRRTESLGRTPVAVVNRLFHSAEKPQLESLTEGFDEIELYSDTKQKTAVPTMLEVSKRHVDTPFFAWFHLYCMHNPYFAETGIQRDSDGPFKERYRRALRWLDKQMRELWDGLVALKIADKSIVILTADHGEGLGDHGLKTHGSFVFDEETRVPLYIRVPGRAGGRISSTVSLVDLTATVTDLLGKPVKDTDGVSFAPLLSKPDLRWNRDYYLENSSNNYMGVVHGRDKLFYFVDGDTLYRFDLENDPDETQNIFNLEGDLDQLLLARLVFHRPDLFIAELDEEKTRDLFDRLSADLSAQTTDAAALLRKIASAATK